MKCADCKYYYSVFTEDEDGDECMASESCDAPLPVFVESALRSLECYSPEDFWDSAVAGKFCNAFSKKAPT